MNDHGNGGFVPDGAHIEYTTPKQTQPIIEKVTKSMITHDIVKMPPLAVGPVYRLRKGGQKCYSETNVNLSDLMGFQVRANKKVSEKNVRKYAMDMRNGDEFPPITISRDRYVIDGNTRRMAAKEAGLKAINAIVIEVDLHGAPSKVESTYVRLGTWLNRITKANGSNRADMKRALHLTLPFTQGFDSKVVALKVGCSASFVAQKAKAFAVRAWAEGHGISIPEDFSDVVLAVFANKVTSIKAEVLIALLRLAVDFTLTIGRIKVTLGEVEVEVSETEQLAIIASERIRLSDIGEFEMAF